MVQIFPLMWEQESFDVATGSTQNYALKFTHTLLLLISFTSGEHEILL